MTENRSARPLYGMVFGILLSIGALVALLLFTDANQVWEALRKVPPGILLAGATLVIVSLLTRAYAWRNILQDRITLWQSFLIINAGYFVNTILPFRLGELSRALLLMPSELGFWEAVPAIALERMFDGLFALGMLFIGLPFALDFQLDIRYSYLLALVVLAGLALAYLLVKNRGRIIGWLENTNLLGSRIRARLVRFLDAVLSSMQVLTSPARLARVLLGMALSWGIALSFQYLLLQAMIPGAKLGWAAFILGAVAVGVSLPSSPGNIGVYEASITLALAALGVDHSLAFSYALTSHVISLAITTGLGAFGLVREGVGLREVWQFGRQHIKGEEI